MRMDSDHIAAGSPIARNAGEIRKLTKLVDARALAKKHEWFEQPTQAEIRKIKPGQFVKVNRKGERFWIKVRGFEGRRYHGQVANVLAFNEDLMFGDHVYFERKNIYDIQRAA